MKSKFLLYTFLIIAIVSCVGKKDWQLAKVVDSTTVEREMYVYVHKNSYYNFVRAKDDLNQKVEILIPENVSLVESADFKYISMYFDESVYGMNSYSFGSCIAGNDLMLVETKFQAKTCACKTSGTYFKGYFLVYNDSIIKLKTDNENNIQNKAVMYNFVDEYAKYSLPQSVNSIRDVILFLESINN